MPTMQQYGEFITKRPFLVIFLSLFVGFTALFGAQQLRFTNDYRYFFSSDNPYLTAFEELERTYSSPDTIVYVYQPKDGSAATAPRCAEPRLGADRCRLANPLFHPR